MTSISDITNKHRPDLAPYEELYKYFHANPELSNQEKETAAHICKFLRENISPDFDIRPNIGGHGIAALLHNGSGPTVLLRADFDALPVEERTGLPYASKRRMKDADGVEKPVMHACGHDMHITCLLAAAQTLVSCKEAWSGTLLLAFQPAEERGTGAQAMVDDGMYDPKKHNVSIPDVCIGGHVIPWRAGVLGTRRGLMATSADSMRVTLHGRGGHASMPNKLIDPVVMAASTIMKLQTIVSREIDPADHAVVTVASVQAGDAENVVVDDARLAVDFRATNQRTRDKTMASVKRIINAEALGSNAVKQPTITLTRSFPLTINDDAVTQKLEEVFTSHFPSHPKTSSDGSSYNNDCPKLTGSEDFSILGTAVDRPTSFFMYGGTSHEVWDRAEAAGRLDEDVPVNHSGLFAPVLQPTLRVGVDAYVCAALGVLGKK
ncbi:N(alpha)-acyl-glutamine aminoacylase [Fulvia fulva]|uniref:N(Alpha)-acyl-glutamine aminoacylase n=1 Tax=Passalora fulva TaxID=5499 RepID=A0A9Q8PM22_PASFU|nr:N(alpha)-acyl-glutamine aminoacylase [Fulvia fulva]KAK4608972.1 N(alpha)-acyl-glutamine aminoacylase [Fulvia fulva]KAK4609608.1 N(alpha)-acyl-glutamine aminoacylase [Fulvia fulva]UJO25035.1 N(alpha)-acyl-glutamine aminoacylase [Fulvia fulva]WPV22550.1 N(alpha)-acyl-glutamine aminoacylase [Fulvia fulva]WPV37884.1 N(alpha)-acyl-glutamine aminoacylase [Fulvia fulva]